jgi:dTDP-4-amino-4,6-dideoxygalactose transaminase
VYQGIPPYSKALAQVEPSYWLNLAYVDSHATRRALQAPLALHGVQVRPVFMPFPEMPYLHPFWANPSPHPREAFPHAYRLWERGFNLPSSPQLSEVDQAEVMALVQSFLSAKP